MSQTELSRTYYDKSADAHVIKVFAGDCYVTDKKGQMMVTVLGSCIAACIRDPIAGVGGMNHFLLPDSVNAEDAPMRYGAYSMEKLINDLLKMGARKSRLEIKIFGGGNVIKSSAMVGSRNVDFIRKYLKDEGLVICQEDLGGTAPRRIHYYPETGKAMMRKLSEREDVANVEEEEIQYSKKISTSIDKDNADDLEFF